MITSCHSNAVQNRCEWAHFSFHRFVPNNSNFSCYVILLGIMSRSIVFLYMSLVVPFKHPILSIPLLTSDTRALKSVLYCLGRELICRLLNALETNQPTTSNAEPQPRGTDSGTFIPFALDFTTSRWLYADRFKGWL